MEPLALHNGLGGAVGVSELGPCALKSRGYTMKSNLRCWISTDRILADAVTKESVESDRSRLKSGRKSQTPNVSPVLGFRV